VGLGDIFYWPCYNAYFAAIGDDEHRGHQVSAREALAAVSAVIAPLLGAWALVSFGPLWMFAGVGLVQALSALPLLGAPNVAVAQSAPGAIRAARLGILQGVSDGWFDTGFFYVWQIALYLSLGASVTAYGGAMAVAGLVGAAGGLILGRSIDRGSWKRAMAIAMAAITAVVLMRAFSGGLPWLAVASNALGAAAMALLSPVIGAAMYPLAKASPCPIRFTIATEAGWDTGAIIACLLGAGLLAAGVQPTLATLLALPGAAAFAWVLWVIYRGRADAAPG
jgi:MFS family permease